MTTFNPRDVVLIPFPFSDLSGTKNRPALIIAVAREKGEDYVGMMLTFRKMGKREGQ